MRRFFSLIHRMFVALAATTLGVFAIFHGLSGTSAMDIAVAVFGAVVIGIAYWFGKRFTSNNAPLISALLALVALFGFGFSLVEKTELAFVLFGVVMISGGIAFFLAGVAPRLLGIDPKTYEYGSNIFFDSILLPSENSKQPPRSTRKPE